MTLLTPTLLTEAIARIGEEIDFAFDALLTVPDDPRSRLYEAMRHAAMGGGKRLRPLLVLATADLFNVSRSTAIRVGLAVESIHVYSLIHDDLPSMDNDDLRRGRPTVHRAFDEATALLAGDCLHDLAYELLASADTHPDPFVRAELIRELARASGPAGMAGGQMMDLQAEGANFDFATVARLQQLKTGALIGFCMEAGAILGHVPHEARVSLRGYGHDLGLAFQIVDDLLDVGGDPALAGKALGKDAAAGKATFVSHLGLEGARARAHMLVDQAKAHLRGFGGEADLLRAIADYVMERDR